jgi:alpha-tubulin suppressor-like RCC1 family protein
MSKNLLVYRLSMVKTIFGFIYLDALQMKVKYISAGYFHVLAVTESGMTFCWGRNDYGQLGIGKKENFVSKPTKIKSLSDRSIVMVAAGENHSLFLCDQGEVLSSGFNEFGELGIGANAIVTQEKKDFDELYDE